MKGRLLREADAPDGATVKKAESKPIYKANYGEATPEQVALALLRHRPDAPEAVKRRLPTQPREPVPVPTDQGEQTG